MSENGPGTPRAVRSVGPALTATYILVAIVVLSQATGCVSAGVEDNGVIISYLTILADQGPQERVGPKGLDLLSPKRGLVLPDLETTEDEKTGKTAVHLSLEQAVERALTNSLDIRWSSYDPAIAKDDVTRAAAEFDVTAFGSVNYEDNDIPADSIFAGGRSEARSWESGIKQKILTGAEWSLAYGLSRNWDDLTTRVLSTRYEPVVSLQARQPLLRDAWQQRNIAGVNVSKLRYKMGVLSFRQKTEAVLAQVMSLYWALSQARQDREVQQWLLNETLETLQKLKDRRAIDASVVQIKQAEASLEGRRAELLRLEERIVDVQNALVRLLADHQLNLMSELEVMPVTLPDVAPAEFEPLAVLELAVDNNPAIQQAKLESEIAQINVNVARNERKPRLDLVASARLHGLDRGVSDAHDELGSAEHVSYAVGLFFEYPLGNRQRKSQLHQRELEQAKAVYALQNTTDQVAEEVKKAVSMLETARKEMRVQRDAVGAARVYLEALEGTEQIRDRLTPEFLLLKLQAQETLSSAQRAEIRAVTELNVAVVRLSLFMGVVLDMPQVQPALQAFLSLSDAPNRK